MRYLYIIRVLNVFDSICKFFEIYAYTEKLIDVSILYCDFRSGAIVENYDVAMLAGHNVMYYSDSLNEDLVHKSFESHSKVFQNIHFDLSSIFSTIFSTMAPIVCLFIRTKRRYYAQPEVRSDRIENRNIKSKYQSISQCMRRTRIINYNQLVCESTMCFKCRPVFGRWVKFSCITMSLLY